MSDTINVKGLDKLYDFLQKLPVKIEKNIARGALRAGMNVIKPVAAANVHSVSGELAKGLKIGTNSRGGVVTCTLKAKGPHGYIAKWIEYGTRPHTITARDRAGLSFGGVFFQSVQHPGTKPRPFLRPALDSQAQAAVIAAANYMERRIAAGGIDTGDLLIEGDEP